MQGHNAWFVVKASYLHDAANDLLSSILSPPLSIASTMLQRGKRRENRTQLFPFFRPLSMHTKHDGDDWATFQVHVLSYAALCNIESSGQNSRYFQRRYSLTHGLWIPDRACDTPRSQNRPPSVGPWRDLKRLVPRPVPVIGPCWRWRHFGSAD